MSEVKPKLERPFQTIKVEVNAISDQLKNKVKLAIQDVVSKIKAKHL